MKQTRFPQIKFGTDGWRAVIAEDFTFPLSHGSDLDGDADFSPEG